MTMREAMRLPSKALVERLFSLLSLTPREDEFLRLRILGHSLTDIAFIMCYSYRTISRLSADVQGKLDCVMMMDGVPWDYDELDRLTRPD